MASDTRCRQTGYFFLKKRCFCGAGRYHVVIKDRLFMVNLNFSLWCQCGLTFSIRPSVLRKYLPFSRSGVNLLITKRGKHKLNYSYFTLFMI